MLGYRIWVAEVWIDTAYEIRVFDGPTPHVDAEDWIRERRKWANDRGKAFRDELDELTGKSVSLDLCVFVGALLAWPVLILIASLK